MNIIIAPDKMKGSLSSIDFCRSIEKGILKYLPQAHIIKVPMADGGDGTVEVIKYYLGGEKVQVEVQNPVGKNIQATYLFNRNTKTAFIEMAEASGLHLLKKEEKNPLLTSTFGTGQLINHAIEKGVTNIILGIGGSATNDAGMGMARALGYRFFDQNQKELKGIGHDLIHLHRIDSSQVYPQIHTVKFSIASDVNNLFFGKDGAAYVYASQKGASPQDIKLLDNGLRNFNEVVKKQYQLNLQNLPGSGAAGGLGGGSRIFLNASIAQGIELMKTLSGFSSKIENADWIITGEGSFDDQTLSGKVIQGILQSVTKQKVAIICGIYKFLSNDKLPESIHYMKEIKSYAQSKEDSMKNASLYVQLAAEEFTRQKLIF